MLCEVLFICSKFENGKPTGMIFFVVLGGCQEISLRGVCCLICQVYYVIPLLRCLYLTS